MIDWQPILLAALGSSALGAFITAWFLRRNEKDGIRPGGTIRPWVEHTEPEPEPEPDPEPEPEPEPEPGDDGDEGEAEA